MDARVVVTKWRRALAVSAARRGLLAGLGGLFTTGPFALDANVVTARKGKRQKKRKRKRNKNQSPAPIPAGPVVRAAATCSLPETTGFDLFSWRGDSGDPCIGQTFRSPVRTAPFAPFGSGVERDFVFTVFVSA